MSLTLLKPVSAPKKFPKNLIKPYPKTTIIESDFPLKITEKSILLVRKKQKFEIKFSSRFHQHNYRLITIDSCYLT